MGWVWRDDEEGDSNSWAMDINPRLDGDRCSTRKVVQTQCKTEEVEPGKFMSKCEKTEQLLRDYAGWSCTKFPYTLPPNTRRQMVVQHDCMQAMIDQRKPADLVESVKHVPTSTRLSMPIAYTRLFLP